MATIQVNIELNDYITGVLNNIMTSVSQTIHAIEGMQEAMNANIDTSSLESARAEIDRAAASAAALEEILNRRTASGDRGQDADPPPARWQSYTGPEVFDARGMERFRRETASANAMLDTLSQTQTQIADRAAQLSIFPSDMTADINGMQSRLAAVREHMKAIENNPLNMGTDEENARLEQLREQLSQAVQAQGQMNQAVEDLNIQAANEAYQRLSQIVGNTERYIRDNADAQGCLNQEIQNGKSGAERLKEALEGVAKEYLQLETLSKVMDLADKAVLTSARLEMVNDGRQTTQELQNMIYSSAEQARMSYQTAADAVSKLGFTAGDAFGSTEEIVAFVEQINKQLVLAGTGESGFDAALEVFARVMDSGVFSGEEYNSVLEQAPNIIQTIADYLEVPRERLKELAEEGMVTAQMVKAAMFTAADETNAKLENMPKTFSQIWSSFQNTALMAFQPVLQRITEIGNSTAFQEAVNIALAALSAVAGIALDILDLLMEGMQFMAENWSWLSPVIYGVAGALAVYYGWQLAANAVSVVSKGIHLAMAAAQMAHAAATGGLTKVTAAAIAAQNGLNASMYACPIVWIIMLVIALIAVFYGAVAAGNHFAGTSVSATGIICGIFMVAAAFLGNLFVTLFNFIIDIFVVLWNFIAAFANFFGNVFHDPVEAVARLFFDLVDAVLGLLETLASAVDTLFGSNLAGAVSGWRDSLSGWVIDTFGQGEIVMEKMDADDFKIGRFEYGAAWNAGYTFGEGIDEIIGSFDPASLFDTKVLNPGDDIYPDVLPPENPDDSRTVFTGPESFDTLEDIAEDTGAISNALEITQEDLKYLRDIAEQEAINRYTTAEIKIEQTNNNNISSEMDLDGIVACLEKAVDEAAGYAVVSSNL